MKFFKKTKTTTLSMDELLIQYQLLKNLEDFHNRLIKAKSQGFKEINQVIIDVKVQIEKLNNTLFNSNNYKKSLSEHSLSKYRGREN